MQAKLVRASARYSGRISAELSLGDVVLLLRPQDEGGDGACLVFSSTRGVTARNWMPSGSRIARTDYGYDITHDARGERLQIFIERVYGEIGHVPALEGELTKLGAESEMADLLAAQLHVLGPRLVLVAREHATPAGPVDIWCAEMSSKIEGGVRPVLVETKRVRCTPSDVYQLRRYLDAVDRTPRWEHLAAHARGILAAPVLAKKARAHVDADPRITFVRVSYDQLAGAVRS